MTFREYIEQNGIENLICYNNANDSYFFEYQDSEGYYYEGEVIEDHMDFDFLQDEEIVEINAKVNAPNLTLYFNIQLDEE